MISTPNPLTANAPGVGFSDLVVPRGPNYREASKVKAVGEIFGMRYIVHSDMPPNEIHLVQDDQCVGKIILSESRHNAADQAQPPREPKSEYAN